MRAHNAHFVSVWCTKWVWSARETKNLGGRDPDSPLFENILGDHVWIVTVLNTVKLSDVHWQKGLLLHAFQTPSNLCRVYFVDVKITEPRRGHVESAFLSLCLNIEFFVET